MMRMPHRIMLSSIPVAAESTFRVQSIRSRWRSALYSWRSASSLGSSLPAQAALCVRILVTSMMRASGNWRLASARSPSLKKPSIATINLGENAMFAQSGVITSALKPRMSLVRSMA